MIRPPDITWLPRREAEQSDDLWKPMMWGSWRDIILLRRLRRQGITLAKFMQEKKWEVGRGFQVGKGEPDKWIASLPLLESKSLSHFYVARSKALDDWNGGPFSRSGKKGAYSEPHVICVRGKTKGRFGASYLDFDCAFNDTMIGISGPRKDTRLLKALTAYLNSKVANYFLFMTAGEWGVERDRIAKRQLLDLPALPLQDVTTVEHLSDLFNEWVAQEDSRTDIEKNIDRVVKKSLNITQHESILIEDCVNAFTSWGETGTSAEQASTTILYTYARIFLSAVSPVMKYSPYRMVATVHLPEQARKAVKVPLALVSFRRVLASDPELRTESIKVAKARDILDVLQRLDTLLRMRFASSVYVERHLRLYDMNTIYIVKPFFQREWQRSAALHDADGVIAEMLGGN